MTLALARSLWARGGPDADLSALQRLLERTLKGAGRLTATGKELAGMAGDLAVLRHDFAAAVRWYRSQGSALSPARRRQLALAKELIQAQREGRLTEASPYAHFTVLVGAKVPYREAEALREAFERARNAVGAVLRWHPQRNLLVRVLEGADYDRLLSPHVDGVSETTGILLRKRPDEEAQELEAVVRHEYVHHVLREMTGGRPMPLWFHEGVATWLEADPASLGTYKRVLEARNRGRFPSHLELRSFPRAEPLRSRLLYDVAGLLIQRIVDRLDTGALLRTIEQFAAGAAEDEVLRSETGRSLREHLEALDQQMLELVRERIRFARHGPRPRAPEDTPELLVETAP